MCVQGEKKKNGKNCFFSFFPDQKINLIFFFLFSFSFEVIKMQFKNSELNLKINNSVTKKKFEEEKI